MAGERGKSCLDITDEQRPAAKRKPPAPKATASSDQTRFATVFNGKVVAEGGNAMDMLTDIQLNADDKFKAGEIFRVSLFDRKNCERVLTLIFDGVKT